VGGNERYYRGGRETNLTSVLKVLRHCPFVLQINVKHLTGTIEVYFCGVGGGGVAFRLNLNGNRSLTGCCRLLGYQTPVRTAQEAIYVSITQLSRLVLGII
jgi:hypothetical protein